MPSPRWLARLAIPMMAGAALVSSAAIATAANPRWRGIPGKTARRRPHLAPQTEEALIGEAHLICYDLTWDSTPQQIADDIHAHLNARAVTLADVGTMVIAAHSTYCPGKLCDAPTLCT